MTEQIEPQRYAAAEGTTFRASSDNLLAPVDLKLISAQDRSIPGSTEYVSLLLEGPPDPPLTQGIYHLEHDELGAQALFLTAVGRSETAMQYEIIFNRILQRGDSENLPEGEVNE